MLYPSLKGVKITVIVTQLEKPYITVYFSGTIEFQTSGTVTKLVLEHQSGFVGCRNNGVTGFWGGCAGQRPLNVWITEDKAFPGTSRPSNLAADIIFPRPNVLATATNRGFYEMGTFSDSDTEIEFLVDGAFINISAGTKYRIWYGEDLFNRAQGGNQGTHCVKVFASYFNDLD